MSWIRACAAAALILAVLPDVGVARPLAPLAPGQSAAYNQWLRIVQARLIRSVTRAYGFPRKAVVVVRLVVERDGRISDVRAVSSSDPDPRYPALATRTVGSAGPFPPIPASYQREHATIQVPLVYNFTSRGRSRRRH